MGVVNPPRPLEFQSKNRKKSYSNETAQKNIKDRGY